jgi:PAS domain S-box-containing protein
VGGVWGIPGWSKAERRGALAAVVLLVGLTAADLASGNGIVLIPALVLPPLLAGLLCPTPFVAFVGAVAVMIGLPLGARDEIFGNGRHLIDMVVLAGGSVLALAIARTRVRLVTLREAEGTAFRRISLLDRSSRLIGAPMDFRARLAELSRLVIPDVADLAMIDLATPDGRLDGVVASATDPEMAEIVERTRAVAPLDPAGEHPVAVALRTGQAQLRGAMTDEQLSRYAASPEHLELMRRLQYSSAIVVPLIVHGRTLGVLSVLRLGTPVAFDEADLALMTDLASRAALLVDNARRFEEQRQAETRLQTVLDNLAEAITMIGADGQLVYVNSAAAELFGYGSAEEALRIPVARMFADFELYDEGGEPLDVGRLPGRRALAGQDPQPVTLRRVHRATGEERWLRIKASSVPDPATGRPNLAVNVIEDVTDERRAGEAAAFLSEASKLLASSLEYEETLRRVAEAAVPQIADWCGVDLVDEDGALDSVAIAHVQPDMAPIVAELRDRYPADPRAEGGTAGVVRSGRSELYGAIDPALLQAAAVDERHLELLHALDMSSVLIVPMVAGERHIGTITFVTTGGRRRLSETDRQLAEELGRRAGVAVENARIHHERSHVATTLQRSLLPPRLPVVPGLSLAARFRAAGEANQVGGDFYDLVPMGGGWLLVIGDVTGKGPDAAATTSLARYTIRTAAMYESEPVAIMRRLNEALLAHDEQRQMCTAACLHVKPGGAGEPVSVDVVCAGHPPPYLVRPAGDLDELCRPGPLLGAFHRARWEPVRLELEAGDGIVLYTDGVTDARGEDGRFGHERLEAVLREVAGLSADAIAEALDTTLINFQHGPQRDDVALLVLRAGDETPAAETSLVAGSSSVPT